MIPIDVNEALNSEHSSEWLNAMENQYKALLKNKTWITTALPSDQKPIGCKWVFSVKTDINGNVEKFKARLVAKGCSQKYGLNYKETFSPVIKYSTIRLLLAIAVEENMYLHQLI